MRTASILLALVVVLGALTTATAQAVAYDDFTISISGVGKFGFQQWGPDFDTDVEAAIYLGPVGSYPIPCTAAQGLIGFIVIVAVLVIALIAAVVGWKRKVAR